MGSFPVYCLTCGAARTFDSLRPHLFETKGDYLTCFRCGGDAFDTKRERVPQFSRTWVLTMFDREFLRELQIAPDEHHDAAEVTSDEARDR
jgi:hypothetical protein